MSFELHPQLEADTLPLGDLLLSRVRLMNDARFPWLVLVPRRPDLREFIDLPAAERSILMEEIAAVSLAMREVTEAEKLNVAALGNRVPQLHVHVISRFATDLAWPAPVWGAGSAQAYTPDAQAHLAQALHAKLAFI
ncbi:MAG: HIT domain-containing protein [Hyphomicrobiales bacterium]|nr:HIT family protein [Hyphomicrobiales bacterium]MDE2018561.1 HIT domain-containing protein [Hyphomicrobiales bacterium]